MKDEFQLDEVSPVAEVNETKEIEELEVETETETVVEEQTEDIVETDNHFDELETTVTEVKKEKTPVKATPHIAVTAGTTIKKDLSLPFKTNVNKNADLPKAVVRTRAKATVKKS